VYHGESLITLKDKCWYNYRWVGREGCIGCGQERDRFCGGWMAKVILGHKCKEGLR
jgi:hypothetical protein